MSLDYLTIAEAARLIKNHELSPVELVENKLQRIDKLDGKINSFIRVLGDEAKTLAKKQEAEIMAGDYRGPLHGIPIGLKDVYDLSGVPTTAHSKILLNNIPSTDAFSVKCLKEAGAIMVGKLATHEFALGGPSFDLPWPPARNPWDLARFTGGSSSGTAAAVAAGLVLGGTASDTGGSIRTPAALCGVAGLKPSYGLISRSGVLPLAWSLESAGMMATTVEDCAILLQTMAGFDPADRTSAHCPIPDYSAALTQDLKGLRVGLLRHFYTSDDLVVSEEVKKAIEDAAKKLEALGCIVEELQLSPLAEWAACGTLIMMTEAYAVHEVNLQKRFLDFGEVLRDRLALAGLFTAADYIQALRKRQLLIEEFDRAMQDFDIIITATSAGEAPKIETIGKFSIFERPLLTIAFNVTGSPAMSVCCGYSDVGLPLGMQIVGRRFEDAMVLRVADAYERATPWHKRHPML